MKAYRIPVLWLSILLAVSSLTFAVADEKIPWEPVGLVQASASGTQFSGSFTYQPNSLFDNFVFGLTLKIPSLTSGADADTELTQFTSSWRFGLKVGKAFTWGDDRMIVDLEPEWGIQQFVYYPGGGSQQSSNWKHSVDLSLHWWYQFDLGKAVTLEAIGRFAYDWQASPSVGIVTPGSGSTPAMVTQNEVIEAAQAKPNISGRLFAFVPFGGNSFAVGPSIAAIFSGKDAQDFGFSKSAVGRAEFWFYFLPSTSDPPNLRFGISPYVSYYFTGTNAQGQTIVPGFVFQFRAGGADKYDPVFLY